MSGSVESYLIFFAALGTVLGLPLWAALSSSPKLDAIKTLWQTAREVGLQEAGPRRMVGRVGGSDVTLWQSEELDGGTSPAAARNRTKKGEMWKRQTVTHVTVSCPLPCEVGFSVELGIGGGIGGKVPIGDRRFDDAVCVTGDVRAAFAILDPELREEVVRAVYRGWRYEAGVWKLHVSRRIVTELPELLKQVSRLAQAMRDAVGAIASHLLERACSDRDAGVRLACLKQLAFGDHARELAVAFESALGDPIAAVRLFAATELRRVSALLTLALDASVPTGLRVDALEAALKLHHESGAAEALARATPRLTDSVLTAHHDAEWAAAVARFFGVVAHPDGEALLIRLLDDKDDQVRLDVVTSLARRGTVAAVPALVRLRDGLLAFTKDWAVKAKDAIAAIQARTGRVELGALALIDDARGGLALSDGDGRAAREPGATREETAAREETAREETAAAIEEAAQG